MIEFDIAQLFPKFLLSDRNGFAMATAIERALRILCDTVQRSLDVLQDVEKMPEWRLDEMAWELNLPWYEYDQDIQGKRNQILSATQVYAQLGTTAAVERVIQDIYGSGYVEEWFQYQGDAFSFQVYTDNFSALQENHAKFLRVIDQVKNVRSVLDNIYYAATSGQARAYARAAAASAEIFARSTARAYGG